MPTSERPPPPEERRRRAGRGTPAAAGGERRMTLARIGEELAAAHLTRLGFSVLARNVRTREGEIDLVAFGAGAIVFVEVKTRRIGGRAQGIRPDQEPLRALGPRQCARLRRLAAAWLYDARRRRPRARTIRFDAIGVSVDSAGGLLRLDHVEGAW